MQNIYFRKLASELISLALKTNSENELSSIEAEFIRRLNKTKENKKNKSNSWVNRRIEKLSGYINQIVSIKDLKFSLCDSKQLLTNKENWYEVFKIHPKKLIKYESRLFVGKNEQPISDDNDYCDNFFSIGKYIRVRDRNNAEKIDADFSKKILLCKDFYVSSLNYFCEILEQIVTEAGKFIISTVPSSQINKTNGIDCTAHLLSCKIKGVLDGTAICAIQKKSVGSWKSFSDHNKSLLKRIKSLPKKSLGGLRSFKIEYESLIINELWRKKIKDRIILLIDDVITSGTSMETCQNILLQAGARRVICLALGRTQNKIT